MGTLTNGTRVCCGEAFFSVMQDQEAEVAQARLVMFLQNTYMKVSASVILLAFQAMENGSIAQRIRHFIFTVKRRGGVREKTEDNFIHSLFPKHVSSIGFLVTLVSSS